FSATFWSAVSGSASTTGAGASAAGTAGAATTGAAVSGAAAGAAATGAATTGAATTGATTAGAATTGAAVPGAAGKVADLAGREGMGVIEPVGVSVVTVARSSIDGGGRPAGSGIGTAAEISTSVVGPANTGWLGPA